MAPAQKPREAVIPKKGRTANRPKFEPREPVREDDIPLSDNKATGQKPGHGQWYQTMLSLTALSTKRGWVSPALTYKSDMCRVYSLRTKTGPPPNLSGRGARFGVHVRDKYIATIKFIHEASPLLKTPRCPRVIKCCRLPTGRRRGRHCHPHTRKRKATSILLKQYIHLADNLNESEPSNILAF